MILCISVTEKSDSNFHRGLAWPPFLMKTALYLPLMHSDNGLIREDFGLYIRPCPEAKKLVI